MDCEAQLGLLPFKVGQLAESRTFINGYRGAWFRCRIKEIMGSKTHTRHALEYIDFPGEKIEWISLYEKPPIPTSESNGNELVIMQRPAFPHIYRSCELSNINTISEATVVISDTWKVGDFVDWCKDDCFWSGRIVEVLPEDKVLVELLQPPFGEGNSYPVPCKDLRPSLDWSPENGWTVPTSKEPGTGGCPSVRLILPDFLSISEEALLYSMVEDVDVGTQGDDKRSKTRSLIELTATSRSRQHPESKSKAKAKAKGKAKAKAPRSRNANVDLRVSEEQLNTNGVSEKMGTSQSSSACSNDSLEGSLVDLAELVCKVKWLKGFLESGNPNAMRPPWEFVEHESEG